MMKDTSLALDLTKSTMNAIYVPSKQIKVRAQNVVDADKLTKVTCGKHEIYEKLPPVLSTISLLIY